VLPSCFEWNDISSLAFLARMPQLREFSVDLFDYQLEAETHQRISAALATFTEPLLNLTDLTLNSVRLSQPQLRALLTLTPQLETLYLANLASLCDLTPLVPVTATLRSLAICWCNHADFTADKLLLLQQFELSLLNLEESLGARAAVAGVAHSAEL